MVELGVADPDKHERVAKALEQINGLRYRYKGAAYKPEKKDINFDSDGDDEDLDDHDHDRAEAKPSLHRTSGQQPKPEPKRERLLTLDDHIERMLLHTRTVALLKIANSTAELLPDDEEDEDDEEFLDEADEYGDDEGGSFKTRNDDDDDERSDRFDSNTRTLSPVGGSRSSSMHRLGSMRRPISFRTAGFRAASGGAGNAEVAAALRLARKLSTFLNLPKVISYKDLEEITESLLDEPHDESEEYAHLIDEHVESARDGVGDDGAVTTRNLHGLSSRSLGLGHMATEKSLRDLNINVDPEDLEMQQRRLFVENAGLRRFSSKKLLAASSRSLLRASSSQLLHGSPSTSQRDLLPHKGSKQSLHHGESWRSGGGGGSGSITSLQEESEDKDNESEETDDFSSGYYDQCDGVYGTTFDEHGYKQWRTNIKDDYLAWIQAKLELKKARRLQKQKDADKKPRWQLLYEAASKGRPTSALDDPHIKAEPRKTSNPNATKRASTRQSVA